MWSEVNGGAVSKFSGASPRIPKTGKWVFGFKHGSVFAGMAVVRRLRA
jgi:hypothetical protein